MGFAILISIIVFLVFSGLIVLLSMKLNNSNGLGLIALVFFICMILCFSISETNKQKLDGIEWNIKQYEIGFNVTDKFYTKRKLL